jgi:hypothetical protein
LVEVGGHEESSGTEPERAWLSGGCGYGSDFRQWVLSADNEERFSCLDAPEEGEKITLKLLHADGTHTIILTGGTAEQVAVDITIIRRERVKEWRKLHAPGGVIAWSLRCSH